MPAKAFTTIYSCVIVDPPQPHELKPETYQVTLDAVLVESFSGLRPIATAPKDGTFILLFGPSGYTGTPLRAEVGRFVMHYNQSRGGWRNHSNDSFEDGGAAPTHWMPIPEQDNRLRDVRAPAENHTTLPSPSCAHQAFHTLH